MKFQKLTLDEKVAARYPKYAERAEAGKAPGFYAFFHRNIHKRCAERYVAENRVQRQILNNMQEMAFSLKLEWEAPGKPRLIIDWVSPSYEKILGFSNESAIGKNILQNIHPDDIASVLAVLSEKVETKEKGFARFRSIKADGTYVWIEGTGTPIIDKNGNVVGGVIVSRDISKRVESEEALKNALTEKDKFVRVIAHDLKGPFNSIMGFSDILANDYSDYTDQERQGFAKNINKVATDTLRLLETLLEYIRMQTGTYDAPSVKLSPRSFAEEEASKLVSEASKKGVEIYNAIKPDIMVNACEVHMATIFHNLLTNAVKFSRPGSKVVVTATARDNGVVEIKVMDHGVGIPEARIPYLFTVCEENKSTPGTAGEKGTGFGLPLVSEMVKKNGGEIWAESRTGENSGTTFHFTLPSAQD